MENPKDLKYSKDHEWIKIDGNIITVGITDFAQNALTEIVFVELPDKGKQVQQNKTAATIESVKSVSDIYAPASGEVIEVNEQLKNAPEKVNKDPYGEGWIFKVKISNPDELNTLIPVEEYNKIAE
ncbi:glycine cleavage system protein H [Candidatus Woesearchaeota archaeon]|nr:glycine cleavage system protein H [Candidatus Woesearchaeota archaeon]|tara:strand:+ start:1373 stop:1750 length:378 start_codon:yes stop_codon:yes gene_type:complete